MKPLACCRTKSASVALAKTAAFMRTVGDENRLRILCLLQGGERCVCEIWRHLDLPQNLTSHHLSVLKDMDLIRARKKGLKVFYSIHEKVMTQHLHSLTHFLWRTQQH
jgi:ArsR family transcriptional regulator